MKIDLSILLSIIATSVSVSCLIYNTIEVFIKHRSKKYIYCKQDECKEIEITREIKNGNDTKMILRYISNVVEHKYLNKYRNNPFDMSVSIKIIIKDVKGVSGDSNVITLEQYNSTPNSLQDNQILKVKDYSEFYSIIEEGKKYFFVSDIKTFEKNNIYNNSSKYKNKWNSSIVYPIYKYNKKKEITGFICVSSSAIFNDVEKNNEIIKELARVSYILRNITDNRENNKMLLESERT